MYQFDNFELAAGYDCENAHEKILTTNRPFT